MNARKSFTAEEVEETLRIDRRIYYRHLTLDASKKYKIVATGNADYGGRWYVVLEYDDPRTTFDGYQLF